MSYPKKSLGQNYLKDDNICRNIVKEFNAWKRDYIIEIGPGKGAITKLLYSKTSNLSVIEIDKENCDYIAGLFSDIDVVCMDILKFDIEKLIREKEITRVSFIGNIPYNITTPILFKLIENRKYINIAQIMMQEEVAQRIVSGPGTKDYGILSILIKAFADVELKIKVSKNCFYPKPNVDSRIIQLKFTNVRELKIKDISHFTKLVRQSFSMRRKTLRNNLKDTIFEELPERTGIDTGRRAESLTLDEFINLSNAEFI